MKVDQNARYSKEHEWVRQEGNLFVYGISDHAQEQLSDIVYVELPEVEDSFQANDVIGVVESVKAAADMYLPIAGEIVEVNDSLADAPELLNSDPYGEGWIVKFTAANPADFENLMSVEDYQKFSEEE
jgi:glycine cleavage system H protein